MEWTRAWRGQPASVCMWKTAQTPSRVLARSWSFGGWGGEGGVFTAMVAQLGSGRPPAKTCVYTALDKAIQQQRHIITWHTENICVCFTSPCQLEHFELISHMCNFRQLAVLTNKRYWAICCSVAPGAVCECTMQPCCCGAEMKCWRAF